jgi:hypothetical protein
MNSPLSQNDATTILDVNLVTHSTHENKSNLDEVFAVLVSE